MRRALDDLMLGSLELFCLAAECGSFAAAAQRAGLTPAAVSRSVARLESRLGTRLFARSTRRLRLTEAGALYHRECREALSRLGEAERQLGDAQQEASGTVRLSLPTALAHRRVLPRLAELLRRWPQLRLDLHLDNRNVDFIAEGFDLAIRGRQPPDSGLVARRLLEDPLVVVAAPDYLARHGCPQALEQLAQHECIQFVLPSSGQRVPWQFRVQGRDLDLSTEGGLCCSGDVQAQVSLARAGAGLAQVSRHMAETELERGELVEVLSAFSGRTRAFSVLYPADRHMPQRVRVVVDFLLELFPSRSERIAL
ncbi:LysR family transcriptional regulator [uncultured Aquimonas sp.]|uniref:LysR family transcriptional regulator n=1 Tax=uncultured Aquimonas sp. TaxID=385483 RepID=UPI00086E95D7|nr:LysR family transcriptional regulator [uncultured Aquimonas sp.]ODU48227.1 MAG: LysR family transcriptional regulator [Xanthomonadaceae bacterium SCN 69-123]